MKKCSNEANNLVNEMKAEMYNENNDQLNQ